MRDKEYNWLYGDPHSQQQSDLEPKEEECESCEAETCDGCVSHAGLKLAEEIRQIKEDEEEHWRVVQENARYGDMLRWHNIDDSV